jgi:hypothetical protein
MQGSKSRRILLSLVLALLASQGGCAWLRGWFVVQDPPPQVLPPGAGLEQVIAAVNQNNSQIQALYSSSATISGPGYPTLRAHIAYQRQRNFRLKAEAFGPEVDLGSNDQIFWFWIKRSQPPAVYYCRHEQFPTSQARRMIPIDPNWLVEALGTLEIDPRLPHQGPYPDKGNRLQIRTILETPEGPNMKVTIVDAVSAWVMEQQIFDAQGRLRARSIAENYRRDPRSRLYVPTAVRVECPEANFTMRIDLGEMQVNQLQGNPAELWAMPSYPGSPPVDLGNPSAVYGAAGR